MHAVPGRSRLAAVLAVPALLAAPALGQCTEGCTAIHTLEGEAMGDQFGWVSNSIGDADLDGVEDFVITAPQNDAGANDAGRIYVYSGATGVELYKATGAQANWWLGHDAGGAGDIDGGGAPDVIAGAPYGGRGRAIIYSSEGSGSIIRTFLGQGVGDEFGYRVGGGGDFDGDGTPDVIIGARRHDTAGPDAGRAYVYSGADFSLICTIDGDAAGDFLGSGVSFIGDVTGDGRDDVVVGAQHASIVGRAYVYSWNGASCEREYTLAPTGLAIDFGLWFMNGGHDVNADGTPDLYVNDYQRNRAYVYDGSDGSLLWDLTGESTGQFGIGRMVDDVDGDCHADLILCAWSYDAAAPNAGKAYVYSGRTGMVLDTYTHDVAGAGFGFDANGMGDVSGDGAFDYLITAASDLGGRGRAYVIAGTITPPAPGDVDGDGVVDFTDLLAALSQFGPCPPAPAPCAPDFDCDGTIGFADLLTILSNWS